MNVGPTLRSGPLRLRHRVGEAIARHGLWQRGDRVAVAVSGGVDSVVLLDVLLETQRWHGARLEVVTIDHGLHPASAEHAAFVGRVAAAHGLPCTVSRFSLPEGADESAARAARYAVLAELPVERVALAHHRGDLAETVLMNLIRGTGAAGLAGIPRVRGRYVRPLLDEDRIAIHSWAEARGLGWIEDPTNRDPRFLRNRIRAEVLPVLEAIRPGAVRSIARSATTLRRDHELIDAWTAADPDAAGPDRWAVSFVADRPEPIVRRALGAAVPGIGATTVDAVIRLARRGQGQVQGPGGAFVVDDDTVVWTPSR